PRPRQPAPDLSRTFDLLVVGGGINGAAIARDAAMRGLSVCLVEKHDWGWGTSAKSSKLAHGGLRYLELFEFGLVHEALQERERFFRQAPHLVRPLRFLYPIYPEVASRRTVRLGLLLYDILSHGKSVPGRGYLKPREAMAAAPHLRQDGLAGAATFYDGQIDHVERLVAEMVWDARQHGATCLARTRMLRFLAEAEGPAAPEAGQAPRRGRRSAAPASRVTGAVVRLPDGAEREVRARATVNATGTWTDDALGELGMGRPPKVRKTKGVHVVVPRFQDVAMIVKSRDGRTFFILPWRKHCILGTTDTDFEGDAGDAVATEEDVRYLVEEAERYVPGAPLRDIQYVYAGVRALVNEEGLTESNVTRRHLLYDHAAKDGVAGLWTLQGGKITTARSLAEECVDQLAHALGRDEAARRHPTRDTTYPGGPLVAWPEFRKAAIAAARAERLPAEAAVHLVDTYGARWRAVLGCDPRPEARTPIVDDEPHVFAEASYAVLEEDAREVSDVMLRRTTLGLATDGRMAAARQVGEWMAPMLGWDRARLERSLEEYGEEVRRLEVPEAFRRKLQAA
ncbi:MAG TPA: glycerol-3-phosphate dehydrogenase/oxidase, partial [Candidatus Thermoplasmatota archaeon]|nr:glycerol-3-phosphate dehydrogenase/oxidase [Candidatus Thermoplasmatota archaeon]